MEEKKYLKWYNKIGYGSGDIADMSHNHIIITGIRFGELKIYP